MRKPKSEILASIHGNSGKSIPGMEDDGIVRGSESRSQTRELASSISKTLAQSGLDVTIESRNCDL